MNKNAKNSFRVFARNAPLTLRYSAFITLVIVVLYAILALILVSFDFSSLSLLGYFLIIIFICMILGFTTPCVISFAVCNSALNSVVADKINTQSFFRGLRVGRTPQYKGIFQIYLNFLYSLLIYIGATIVVLLISFGISYVIDNDFRTFLDTLSSYQNAISPDYDQISQYISDNMNLLNNQLLFTEFFASLIAFYYFLHRYSVHLLRFYVYPLKTNLTRKVLNSIFNTTLHNHRKFFNENYYGVSWIYIVILILTYTSSYFLIYYLNIQGQISLILVMTSMVISLICILPFLSILLNLYDRISPFFIVYFNEELIIKFNEEISVLKAHYNEYSAEDKATIDQIIKNTENQISEINKRSEKGEDINADFNDKNDKKK